MTQFQRKVIAVINLIARFLRLDSYAMNISPKTITCVGEALFDCIAYSHCNAWSAEKVLEKGEWSLQPGGAPANVASALAKFGVQCGFAGAFGQDEDGDRLLSLFKEIGIDTGDCITVPSKPTRKVLVTRNEMGDRQFAEFWNKMESHEFADCYYHPKRDVSSILKSTSFAVITGTLGLAVDPTSAVLHHIANTLKSRSLSSTLPMLVVDVNWRDVFWPVQTHTTVAKSTILDFISNADIVKMTDIEAYWAYGIPPATALAEPELVFDKIQPKKGVLITGGEHGASCYFRNVGRVFEPPNKVDAIDTTGAGDAFTAGFMYAFTQPGTSFLSLMDVSRAMRVASFAGSLTCTRTGAIYGQPTINEVMNLV
eukprot:gene1911-3705_t